MYLEDGAGLDCGSSKAPSSWKREGEYYGELDREKESGSAGETGRAEELETDREVERARQWRFKERGREGRAKKGLKGAAGEGRERD